MNMNKSDDAFNTDDLGRPDVPARPKDKLPESIEKNITCRENTVITNEAAVLSREKLATTREDAVYLRENAADLRELAADLREEQAASSEDAAHVHEQAIASHKQEIQAAETMQAASDDHLIMLQQANAHLVIATIEAQKLAEQVQMAKDQLDHLAHHDVLTSLPNRMLLQDRLIQAIELARRQSGQLAVM
ncbi:MAG: GGDEF domain-containing protein, partial [Methylobacter sp.]